MQRYRSFTHYQEQDVNALIFSSGDVQIIIVDSGGAGEREREREREIEREREERDRREEKR